MTYKEKGEELYKIFAKKSENYVEVTLEISSTNGFSNKDLLSKLSIAKKEFQVASNNFHNFASFFKKNHISPNTVFIENKT